MEQSLTLGRRLAIAVDVILFFRIALFANPFENFFAMHGDFLGCRYADPHLIGIDADDRHRDVGSYQE
jgi:hypothetical protein